MEQKSKDEGYNMPTRLDDEASRYKHKRTSDKTYSREQRMGKAIDIPHTRRFTQKMVDGENNEDEEEHLSRSLGTCLEKAA